MSITFEEVGWDRVDISIAAQERVERILLSAGIPIEGFDISNIVREYQLFKNLSEYENYKSPNEYTFCEKVLEHYLTLLLINPKTGMIGVDVGSCASIIPTLGKRIYGVEYFAQDLMYPKRIHGNQIVSNAKSIPLPNESVDFITLHCAFEHFENNADIGFIKESARLLKKGGKAVIVPFYMCESFCNLTAEKDPQAQKKIGFDSDADYYCYISDWHNLPFCRYYSPASFINRIWQTCCTNGLRARLYKIDNWSAIHKNIWMRWALVIEKEQFSIEESKDLKIVCHSDKSVANQSNKSTSNHPYNKIKKACHFEQLFISHKGDVFPCCQTFLRPEMKIGHINDANLLESIDKFYQNCSCEAFHLIQSKPGDKKDYSNINIELSLACQGKCAMCCVDAPSWKGKYDYYESLSKVIGVLKPKKILLQGGEVLVQKDSLNWVAEIKRKHSDIKIFLVTNGNVDLDMVEQVEALFDRITVSVVGFQPETYKRIMGMNLDKMIKFVELLLKQKKIQVNLKYLITPINLHEANLFLQWAIELAPSLIFFEEADIINHIKYNAPYNFWDKIFERTGQEIRSLLISNKDKIFENNTSIKFSTMCLSFLDLNDAFFTQNNLTPKVGKYIINNS